MISDIGMMQGALAEEFNRRDEEENHPARKQARAAKIIMPGEGEGGPLDMPPAGEAFDAEVAMDTEGFLEFLELFEDAGEFDTTNEHQLEIRYRAFINQNETATSMAEFAKTELADQYLGVRFDDADLAQHVEGAMDEMAFKDPEKLNEIHETMTEYNRLQKDIQDANRRIEGMESREDLEANLAALKEKEAALTEAEKVSGFFARKLIGFFALYEKVAFSGMTGMVKDWLDTNEGDPETGTREDLKEYYDEMTSARRGNEARLKVRDEYSIEINPDAIREELEKTQLAINETQATLDILTDLDTLHTESTRRFNDMREVLFDLSGVNGALRELAETKVRERLNELIDSDPEEALNFFGKTQRASGKNSFGASYFKEDRNEILRDIQSRIEGSVAENIADSIDGLTIGTQAYRNIVSVLSGHMSRESIGLREGDEKREFIMTTLTGIGKKLVNRNQKGDKARAMLIKFALGKLTAAK